MGCCVAGEVLGEMDEKEVDYEAFYRIVIVGDAGVGKSSIVLKYTDNVFGQDGDNIDFRVKYEDLDGKRYKLQIWDTAGQEKFRQMSNSYYRAANAVIIAFDLNDPDSPEQLQGWIEEVTYFSNQVALNPLSFIVIGNKSDLEKKVNSNDITNIAKNANAIYIETSARTGENIQQAFQKIIEKLESVRLSY